MKAKTFFIAILILTSFISFSQKKQPPIKMKQKIDTILIRKLGADEYGMKKFVMCFLKAGPNKSLTPDSSKKIQAAHMQNMNKLVAQGKLIVAGPFLDETELEGIFIFNVSTIEEAKVLTNTDPAVKAGVLIMELHPWYGSAALIEIPVIHTKIQKKKF